MNIWRAERLMNRPLVEQRPVIGLKNGERKEGFLVSFDGVNAVILPTRKVRTFSCSIEDVHPR